MKLEVFLPYLLMTELIWKIECIIDKSLLHKCIGGLEIFVNLDDTLQVGRKRSDRRDVVTTTPTGRARTMNSFSTLIHRSSLSNPRQLRSGVPCRGRFLSAIVETLRPMQLFRG